ncbi:MULTISPECIES: peptidogalycan biosysnthesis protein [Polaribacter]|uniref:Peptidogalycan biosysnthesis protein n=1 Tax=Polaribacter sejongensis TaxID=985043 RepID=A0AAJ1R014_9FLAO|nr:MULTISPECIES: peptidogalycan biosysnthesis protein [Polaribacter]MDN3620915.1 peptidogalycan biosysnthesis protein [Polaribacter undariae]UWD31048.1 peptidogalycan biosysnthesis protein [Polaribacter undariae]
MICCTHTNTAKFFSSIDEIPSQIWDALNCRKNSYFHPDFLKYLEQNHPEITFSYIVLVDQKNKPTAFACLTIINFELNSIKNDFEVLKDIGKKLHVFPDKKPLQLLICGNPFVSGEHGIFIAENQDKKAILKELAESINHFVNSDKKLKKQIDALLVKDFTKESLDITDTLKKFSYHPFSVEPNMKLQLHENWQNFDDYLAAMKTKFRVKAKKAFKQSAAIIIKDVTLENIDKILPEMTTLYEKVASNADFNLGVFNLETYRDFKKLFGENYILKSYCLDDKIVGFVSGIINQESLDAHFVGIDYQLNREHAIYQRMLYDYIEIAIDKNLKTINFGRTASEIKSSVGAVPQDLTMYLRHQKTIKNKILKLFLQRVQPTPFQQKFPFKTLETKYEKH